LAYDPARGVLLQHRVAWSHFGGTWGLPGGAMHENESAIAGAVREAQEEAGVPDGAVRPRFVSVLDLEVWSYSTVLADVLVPFDPVISDPESVALEWVPVAEVDSRPLHPGFARAWPMLRALLDVYPAVVVDAANVVGSVPDGWWKDRAGAAARLRERLRGLRVSGEDLGLDGTAWFPEVSLVVEGRAREIARHADTDGDGAGGAGLAGGAGVVGGAGGAGRYRRDAVKVVEAPAAGDDAIVDEAARLVALGRAVTVVTSDRELRERSEQVRAHVRSTGWLRGVLDASGESGR